MDLPPSLIWSIILTRFSAWLYIMLTWSTRRTMSSMSLVTWSFAFSRTINLEFKFSIVPSDSASLAWSFSFVISSSSILPIASFSYFDLQWLASAIIFCSCRAAASFCCISSSKCSFTPSYSCSRVRNLPRRLCLGLVLAHPLDVLQLAAQVDLHLLQHGHVVQHVLQLGILVRVLCHHPLVLAVIVSKNSSALINLLAQVAKLALQRLQVLVSDGLLVPDVVGGRPGVVHLHPHRHLVLLHLRPDLVQLVALLGHLRNRVLLLLPQTEKSRLVLDIGLLQILLHLQNLGVSLLVQLDLGRGGDAGLVEPVGQLLVLAAQVGSLTFRLCSTLPLSFQLLLHLLDAGLQLLDLPLSATNTSLLVVQLAHHRAQICLLAQDAALQFLLGALQVQDGFLAHL